MIQGAPHAAALAAMLVPLDAIFDTRLGTIAKIGMDVYRGVQVQGYYSRRSDHFEGVDSKEYFRLYRERDAVTLSMSSITHIVSLVRDFVHRVHKTSASSPVQMIPRVDINVYPYDPPEHVTAMIEKAIRVLVQDKFDVSFVRYSPKDLHYDLVKFTYDHMVMYNVGEWINAQASDWKRRDRAHTELTVFIPILAHTEDITEVPVDIAPMAEEFERIMAPLMNITQLPIGMFSQIVTPFAGLKGETTPEPEGPEVDQE